MKQNGQSYNVKLNVMLVLIKLEIMKGLPIFVSTWGPNSKKLLYDLSYMNVLTIFFKYLLLLIIYNDG